MRERDDKEIGRHVSSIEVDPMFSTLAVVSLLEIQIELFLDIRRLLRELLEKEGVR